MMTRGKKRGFTLLEVLIAGGVLFVVSSAIVGLNNSIIQGTAANADQTVTNRWASEGLELVSANRDNNLIQGNVQNGSQLWFSPAADSAGYGWYKLTQAGNQWQLSKVTASNNLTFTDFNGTLGETLTSQSLTTYRLICIEAVGAAIHRTDTTISCNTDEAGAIITSDGDRALTNDTCDPKDVYCINTKPSLNRDQLTGSTQKIVPAGNAIKVRAVVVWPSKSRFQVSDLAMILTNWKGFEQQ